MHPLQRHLQILLLASLSLSAQAQPKETPSPESISLPTTDQGIKIDDLTHTRILYVYSNPAGPQSHPEIHTAPNNSKQVLPFEATADGQKTFPLRQSLIQFKKDAGENAQIILYAPAHLLYAQLQQVLQECAAANITRVNFATKPAAKNQAAIHYLPCALPIKPAGKPRIDPKEPPKPPEETLEIFIAPRGQNLYTVRLSSGAEFINSMSKAGQTLTQALEEKRQATEAAKKSPENITVILAPKLSTRYADLIATYEAALTAKWPKITFQSATN